MTRTRRILAVSATTGAFLGGIFALATLGEEKQEVPAQTEYGFALYESMPDGSRVLRTEITHEDNRRTLEAIAKITREPIASDFKPMPMCNAILAELSSRFARVSAQCSDGNGAINENCTHAVMSRPIPDHVKQACNR